MDKPTQFGTDNARAKHSTIGSARASGSTSRAVTFRLRGTRCTDFARRIGVDGASAFQLVKLHKHRVAILSDCIKERDKAIARGETYFYGARRPLSRAPRPRPVAQI
jgi:hypothetical protein